MSHEDYARALRLGEKAYKSAQGKGHYPYLPALDYILQTSEIQSEIEMGLMDIPLEQIVGTKTAGRQNSFACNFMPLLQEKSEFAYKWSNVLEYQLTQGVGDPIEVYEYLNKYYVLEGNKRVSVLKFLGAYSIEGYVTRLVPRYSADPQVHIFYEYMEFYRRTAINYVWFSREGSFQALLEECGSDPEEIWDEEKRANFSSAYLRFSRLFEEKGGKKLSITVGDAFLLYVSIFPYKELEQKTEAQLKSELEQLWKEFPVLDQNPEKALVFSPEETREGNIFARFFNGTGSKQLKIAFIHDKPISDSGWAYAHDLGRMHLEQVFGSLVKTSTYIRQLADVDGAAVIGQAIADGNHIVFITSEWMLPASLKAAVAHPQVHILNCCVNRSYKSLRTYYGRMYEAKYLEGMIAGAMSANDRIAYAADYPIFGALANINAFALGAMATNPRARVYLHWNCVQDCQLSSLLSSHDIRTVSDVDMIRPGRESRRYGLYQLGEDGCVGSLAAPIWNWGRFYEKIVRDIVSGAFLDHAKTRGAMNYWWGISGGIIDLILSSRVPSGVKRITQMVRSAIYHDMFHPFEGSIALQGGETLGSESSVPGPEEIITMDRLCANVIGELPGLADMNEDALRLLKVQGIAKYRKG